MTEPDTVSADYSLRPSELARTLALLVEARQPVVVWGAPGCAKSQIAQQVAAQAGREYVDVRALLLDPVDLRGIPWRDGADRTRWAPPAFLPPSDADGSWLINLEELPSALPMVQATLFQLVLDRKCGEYELPEGAALIACGNREGDRGVVHRMPTPLASRFVHLEIRVDAADWCRLGCGEWNRSGGPFFRVDAPRAVACLQPPIDGESVPVSEDMGNGLEHRAPAGWPRSGGRAGPVPGHRRRGRGGRVLGLPASLARTAPPPHRHRRSRGRRGPRQRQCVDRALCGSLYRMADDINLGAIVTYATRLRREVGEFLVGSCIRREPALQHTQAFIQWAAAKTR